jgi:hypothetical protein
LRLSTGLVNRDDDEVRKDGRMMIEEDDGWMTEDGGEFPILVGDLLVGEKEQPGITVHCMASS